MVGPTSCVSDHVNRAAGVVSVIGHCSLAEAYGAPSVNTESCPPPPPAPSCEVDVPCQVLVLDRIFELCLRGKHEGPWRRLMCIS